MYQHQTIANASWLTSELIVGKTLNELGELTKQFDIDRYNHYPVT